MAANVMEIYGSKVFNEHEHHTTKIQIYIYNRGRQTKESFLDDSSPVTTNTEVG